MSLAYISSTRVTAYIASMSLSSGSHGALVSSDSQDYVRQTAPCTRCGVLRDVKPWKDVTSKCYDCCRLPEVTRAWAGDGLCGPDDALWFPPDGPTRKRTPEVQRSIERAKAICAQCPVKVECLEYAMECEGSLTVKSRTGIYGGLTANERAHVYRKSVEK